MRGILLLIALFGLPAPARGDELARRDDHEMARAALERGEILPLDAILARLHDTFRGDVAAVELRRERGVWIYAIKFIAPENRLIEASVDARTAQIVAKDW